MRTSFSKKPGDSLYPTAYSSTTRGFVYNCAFFFVSVSCLFTFSLQFEEVHEPGKIDGELSSKLTAAYDEYLEGWIGKDWAQPKNLPEGFRVSIMTLNNGIALKQLPANSVCRSEPTGILQGNITTPRFRRENL